MQSVVNIAAYKFVRLEQLVEHRRSLQQLCRSHDLKGTILLSAEGVNLFVAGTRVGIDNLLAALRDIPGLADLSVKESFSAARPFNRMLIKVKREIIPFGVDEIDPVSKPARRVSPRQLRQWLQENRPVRLLDTRNDFEVKVGTFRDAHAIGIDNFRDFTDAVVRIPETWKEETVITFCTGGIRCEKATPLLEREGFKDIYQLDGGILRYFEECGGEHYEGACFVFDKRVAVDAELNETGLGLCFVCQAILSPAEQHSPQFVEGESCPHCFRTEEQRAGDLVMRRRLAIQAAINPLPGSVARDNRRPLSVPLRMDGLELLDFLDAMRTQHDRATWRSICRENRLECRGEVAKPGRIVRAGERYWHCEPGQVEPDVNADIEIVHEDDAFVVVNKPAPLPMHPCGRFHRNTLINILNYAYAPLRLRPLHRLDADTSGVVLLSKTRSVARQVQSQFEQRTVKKIYLARVQGHVQVESFTIEDPIGPTPGPGGYRLTDPQGLPAQTHCRVVRSEDDGTTLLEVTPLTGRTNQIRIHLWQRGLPIVGDPTYLPQRELGNRATLTVDDPPLCLHARSISLFHPLEQRLVRYDATMDDW